MRTVWKYTLPERETVLEAPSSAKILTVQNQRGTAVLWAEVNSDDGGPLEKRRIVAVPTGSRLPFNHINSTYIATVTFDDGAFVLHYYEVKS